MNVGNYGFKDYLKVVSRRKGLFMLVALAVMSCALMVSYLLPKKYEAQSTVFIEQSVVSDLVKGIAVTPSMDSKVKVLSFTMLSRSMLMDVLRKLDKDVTLSNPSEREAYIESLRQRTSIVIKKKEGVFFVSFRDSSPEFARNYVNMLTQTYIEKNTASKREESMEATRFLSEQIEVFKKRMDAVDKEIDQYKSKHGMVLALNEGSLSRDIDQAQKRLEELRLQRMGLEAKRRSLMAQSPRRQKIANLEGALESLRSRYTENHPQVMQVQSQLEALREGDDDKATLASNDREALEMTSIQLESVRRQEAQQEKIIEESKQLLREIPAIQSGLQELLQRKENEQRIYDQLVSRYGQSEVSKQMELENKSVSFRIIDPAILPKAPVSPNRAMIISGGAMAGLGLAFALAFLLDLLRGAIKSPSELKEFGLPVMGVIPRMTIPEEERRRKRIELGMYMAGGTCASLILAVAISEALGASFVDQHLGVHLRGALHEMTEPGGSVRTFLNSLANRF
ncbi:XrtA system polysaccharide chain length determinant [Desulfohalovibrio reitneri]|uniref:XrtA system polysaccharide chain length determinant n=1 Tax=Desulfohalovibrio reitneri TaxID=1307759 RepID=UPI00068E4725|nr:XrtA system polysaccharide chain length determinant [Desulfohalovibrio reitneri]